MCEFVSWKEMPVTWKPEVERRIYYLTKHDLSSKRGRELKEYLSSKYDEDKIGHGAIDWFYQLNEVGVNKECTDFSDPGKFPAEIVKAIKNGDFAGIGICEEILKKSAIAAYEAQRDALYAAYKAQLAPLYAAYKAQRDALYADYKAKRAPLDADYEAKRDALFWQIAKDPKNRRKEWR